MSVWNLCLEWRNFTEQEVGFQFAQASNECFFFLPFPTKTKQCFYVLCKWFRHVVWQFYFCYIFFFQLKEKPRGKMLGWHFIWTNIWIQNLPGGVARFFFFFNFFFNRKTDDVKREQVVMKTNCLPQKLSYSFFSCFLFLLVLNLECFLVFCFLVFFKEMFR